MRIGLFTMPLFLATIPLAPLVFAAAGHDTHVACYETVYYEILCFGAGAHVVAAAMSAFFTGRGKTSVVMGVDSASSVLNVVLDYAWIFGCWGFPALGIEGAAWATVVAQWSRVLIYGVLMMRPAYERKYRLSAGRPFDATLIRRLLRFGGPNGLQMTVEVSAFSVFILLVGGLGKNEMAATTLAFNINSVAWVPMLGLGIALTTMVGQQLGRDRPAMAARATWTAFVIAQAYLCVMAVSYIAVPDWFLIGHAAGTTPGQFDRIRDVTIVLLRFVAAYSLLDAANIIFVSAIKGAGDTRFVLLTSILMSPLPVAAAWIGIRWYDLGLIWCWIALTFWICGLAVIYLLRFLQGRWRQMRVIEPAAEADLRIDAGHPPTDDPSAALPAQTV